MRVGKRLAVSGSGDRPPHGVATNGPSDPSLCLLVSGMCEVWRVTGKAVTKSGLEGLVAGRPCVVTGSTGMTRNKGLDFKNCSHLGKILRKAFYRENKSVVEEWSFKMFLQTQKFSAVQTQRQPHIRLH